MTNYLNRWLQWKKNEMGFPVLIGEGCSIYEKNLVDYFIADLEKADQEERDLYMIVMDYILFSVFEHDDEKSFTTIVSLCQIENLAGDYALINTFFDLAMEYKADHIVRRAIEQDLISADEGMEYALYYQDYQLANQLIESNKVNLNEHFETAICVENDVIRDLFLKKAFDNPKLFNMQNALKSYLQTGRPKAEVVERMLQYCDDDINHVFPDGHRFLDLADPSIELREIFARKGAINGDSDVITILSWIRQGIIAVLDDEDARDRMVEQLYLMKDADRAIYLASHRNDDEYSEEDDLLYEIVLCNGFQVFSQILKLIRNSDFINPDLYAAPFISFLNRENLNLVSFWDDYFEFVRSLLIDRHVKVGKNPVAIICSLEDLPRSVDVRESMKKTLDLLYNNRPDLFHEQCILGQSSIITTPLAEALKAKNVICIQYLINRGVDMTQIIGCRPLSFYLCSPYSRGFLGENIYSQLIDAGFDINATDTHGDTALHWLCTLFSVDKRFIEDILQSYRPNPFVLNLEGKTPKDAAREYGKFEIVSLLEEYEKETKSSRWLFDDSI